MMKTIVEINSTNYASTGNIMINIANEARKEGFTVFNCYKNSRESKKHIKNSKNEIVIGLWLERNLSDLLSYITGVKDSFNYVGTYLFINKLKNIKPDLIHLHTLHDNYINISMLFNYIKKNNIPVIWTMHDCWAITGQCPAFDMIECDKWKTCCNNCPQIHNTPKSLFFDTSKQTWNKKKTLFSNIKNLHIITPSDWMKHHIKLSFLGKYPIETINNGISLSIFKPTTSNFKENNNIHDKYLVLGVANKWAPRKGIDVFRKLANDLPQKYQIVLVGTNDELDKTLPNNIISIHRTYNQEELAKIYSSCNLFVNPTREENFPTVNIEALACGLPVLTYRTGGSPEIIDETCGKVVDKNDYDSLLKSIIEICENTPYKKEACIKRSQNFDMISKYKSYVDLYKTKLDN